MSEPFSFGAWLQRRRKALDLTQEAFAAQVGCSVITVRRIEADTRRPSKQLAARLADALGLAPEEHESFVKAARAHPAADQPAIPATTTERAVRSFGLRRTNLPAQLTSLVGREQEISHIHSLLRQPNARLLTLTGAGGIGKTRIGLRVAADLLDDYSDGVFFVDLAPLGDATLVVPTIAKVLGRKEAAGQSLIEDLATYLREKHMLLLLDNFEQVIDVAPVIAELLAAAPALHMLVTSRTTLNIAGEHEFVVPPLAVPDPQVPLSAEKLHEYAAAALFVERARAANATVQITDATAPVVADICARLEGLPLAIELAAASASVLSVQQIAARLNEGTQLLAAGSRSAPARHQTLEATIDWSYRLLSPDACAVLRRLSVFVGGWSLEAAEAVCADDDVAPEAVLALLSDLIHKSLVSMHVQHGEARYRMLEMVRQFARKQLVGAGESARTQEKHLLFFAQLIARAKPHLVAADQVTWFARLDAELDNLRAATDRALQQAAMHGDSEHAVRALMMLADLERFWSPRGYSAEGDERLRRALDLPAAHAPAAAIARAHALNAAGVLVMLQGQYAEAWRQVEQALAIGEAQADQLILLLSLRNLGTIAVLQRNTDVGTALLQRCLALGRGMGAEGRHSCAWALAVLGSAAYLEGDDTQASTLFEESVVLLRALGDANFLAMSLRRLGQIALRHQQYERAHALFDESLNLNNAIGSPSGIASCMAGLAGVLLARHRAAEATRLLGAAQAMLDETADQLTAADREMLERHNAQARAHLGAQRFDETLAAGRALFRSDMHTFNYSRT